MTSDWAHLPNAVHIDRVIASVKANPAHWDRAWATTPWDAVRGAAWAVARESVQAVARAPLQVTQDRDAAMVWVSAAEAAAREPAWDALLALIAYDDCAYMLESDPGELAILAKFGNTRAILLLGACKAFHSLKEIA